MSLLSIAVPARNEPYLQKTILDLLSKAKSDIEIIVVLDGYWPPAQEIVESPKVSYIHFSNARGMRNAINSAVAVSKGEFLMKLDAHCMFSDGYDEVLKANCEENWVVVPRRFPLDPVKWQIEERTDNKYPIDYMYLSSELHGVVWDEKNHDPLLKEKIIDETMSNQGSVYFLRRSYFDYLELEDEANYGLFASEFQEVGMKCWLSGGKVMVNKSVWYAHWHKNLSRGYSLPGDAFDIAQNYVNRWPNEKVWHKQTLPFYTMIERFWPVPTWTQEDLERMKNA